MAENHRQARILFNCHDPEQIQEYTELGILGIGRIHRNNPTEVERMINAVRYLVRPEKMRNICV